VSRSPQPRRAHPRARHVRWRPLWALLFAVVGSVAVAGASPVPAAVPRSSTLADASCGTWVLQQVSSVTELERVRPRLEAALALPGVKGLSVRFPWDAADLTGAERSDPILDLAREIADSRHKALAIRFMAGEHTPDRVFRAGAAYYLHAGRRVPLPWSNASGDHRVFLRAYGAYVGRLAAWSRAHRVSLLHLSWYGQEWAELNHGRAVRAAPGYSESAWLAGHRQLIDVGVRHSGSDLTVELPLSGHGPLSGGLSAALADHIISRVGPNSDRFLIQANGWNETQEWGAPSMAVESQFDAIWDKPVRRGLQMIQPDGFDWAEVFDSLDATKALYAEVYLPSFWQVPGPTAAHDHNTLARIAQLESEIEAFAQRRC
jgi:hypothetical protein